MSVETESPHPMMILKVKETSMKPFWVGAVFGFLMTVGLFCLTMWYLHATCELFHREFVDYATCAW